MTPSTFLVLLPALIGLAGAGAVPAAPAPVQLAQNEVVLRIPVHPFRRAPIEWVERKGPRCIAVDSLRGATPSGPRQVDFLLSRKRRVRAELSEDCPALDFYSGFYLVPEDERICADRDVIRSRIGGSCRIERFRDLVPKRRK